jgi:outer membrane protein assembly factor BamB
MLWRYPTSAPTDGAVKSLVFPDRTGTDLYFSTDNTVSSLNDSGSAAALNWSATITGASAPLHLVGERYLYVGSADGRLYELDVTTGTPSTPPSSRSVILGDGLAAVGFPMRDSRNGLLHVGTEAGVIYAITLPLP